MKAPLKYLLIFEIIVFGVVIGNYLLEKKIKPNHYSEYYRVEVKELSGGNGWYYEIYADTHLLIKQENMPGVNGYQFFKSNEDAKKIGLLVVQKLGQRALPNITITELDSCNIDFEK